MEDEFPPHMWDCLQQDYLGRFYEDFYSMQCDVTYKGRCDFEHGITSFWSNDIDDNFDWTLSEGATPVVGTGASVDHTTRTENGAYLYTPSGPPRKMGDKARLSSLTIRGSSQDCVLRLWYHMWGSDIGYLTVLKRYDYTQTGLYPIKTLSGNHGDFWYRTSFDIMSDGSPADFQVVIQGTIGNGSHSDIAIDDLSLTPGCELGGSIPGQPTIPSTTQGKCGTNSFNCQNNKCYYTFEQCDFINNCGDNTDEASCGTSCNFENGNCGWQNTKNDNIDWNTVAAADGLVNMGPSVDHSLNNPTGHYIMVQNKANVRIGNKAILSTSEYRESGPNCNMTFWYYMSGANVGTLSIVLKSTADIPNMVWTKSGDQGKLWLNTTVNIGAFQHFSISLEATEGTSLSGVEVIAVDDISFVGCSATTVIKSCDIKQFMCNNQRECIARQYRCDGRADCSDGSDEDNCMPNPGDCNFDTNNQGLPWTSMCTCWQNRQDDDSDWLVASIRMHPGTGPDVDHKATVNGQFLYIDSSQMRSGEVADIQTCTFPASRNICYVRFWYYMYGAERMGPLRVYTQNVNGGRNLMWSLSDNQGPKWKYANVLVGEDISFTVIFEATRGSSDLGDIAIDDVSFTPECATGLPPVIPTGLICDTMSFFCQQRNQCLPNTWKCDGTWDCPDGSDEANCPTTSTLSTGAPPQTQGTQGSQQTPGITTPRTTISTQPPKTLPSNTMPTTTKPVTLPHQNECPQGQFECASKQCVAGVLVCDGVKDCTDSTDETQPVCNNLCRQGYFYCFKLRQCFPVTSLCDGQNDCGDLSDEQICSQGCPPNFCQNQGQCTAQTSGQANCSCTTGYQGMRCQTLAAAQRSVAPSSSGSGWKIGVGVLFGIIALVLIAIGVFLYMRKRRANSFFQNTEGGLNNPVYDTYGEMPPDFQMSDMETNLHSFESDVGSKMTLNATSIENPLYSDATSIVNPLYSEA